MTIYVYVGVEFEPTTRSAYLGCDAAMKRKKVIEMYLSGSALLWINSLRPMYIFISHCFFRYRSPLSPLSLLLLQTREGGYSERETKYPIS